MFRSPTSMSKKKKEVAYRNNNRKGAQRRSLVTSSAAARLHGRPYRIITKKRAPLITAYHGLLPHGDTFRFFAFALCYFWFFTRGLGELGPGVAFSAKYFSFWCWNDVHHFLHTWDNFAIIFLRNLVSISVCYNQLFHASTMFHMSNRAKTRLWIPFFSRSQ